MLVFYRPLHIFGTGIKELNLQHDRNFQDSFGVERELELKPTTSLAIHLHTYRYAFQSTGLPIYRLLSPPFGNISHF